MENNDVKEKLSEKENDDSLIAKRKALCEGYKEFAEFNTMYAEMCLEADNEALASCEEKLSESE